MGQACPEQQSIGEAGAIQPRLFLRGTNARTQSSKRKEAKQTPLAALVLTVDPEVLDVPRATLARP